MKTQKIKSVLVANRGEIAIRIFRTLKELNIECIAVYSDADEMAPHTLYADRAFHIGASPSSESYLVLEKIIEVAKKSGADAIHPGYGFLSENAEFSKACQENGIIFIGPNPESIEIMGDKTRARLLMAEHNVPTPPGTLDAIQDIQEALEAVKEIGFPVLIKAAAGGGGKGMRVVREEANLKSNIESAQREAQSAFGDGRVYIERFFEKPRHIEIQVAADQHGNTIHLFERECSIQRRHQKVIEEAPSSWVSDSLRAEMGQSAILAAESCSYLGVGTVEFLVDENEKFYFMEMNTRLQVEHPVTEEVTGIDLVREQIRIAEGDTLSLTQENATISGHSIECRIYAEDARSNFMPSPGHLHIHRPPSGPGVRVESGVRQGQDISLYYDPMISKLVTHGPSRKVAIERMRRALAEYKIAGVETTIPFCQFAMDHEVFVDGNYTTQFIGKYYNPESEHSLDPEVFAIAAALLKDKGLSPDKVKAGGSENGHATNGAWTRNRKEY